MVLLGSEHGSIQVWSMTQPQRQLQEADETAAGGLSRSETPLPPPVATLLLAVPAEYSHNKFKTVKRLKWKRGDSRYSNGSGSGSGSRDFVSTGADHSLRIHRLQLL